MSYWEQPGRTDKLRDLWSRGFSASKIAFYLGNGCTRNMVIGKAHRLGLSSRPSPIKTDDPARTERNRASTREDTRFSRYSRARFA